MVEKEILRVVDVNLDTYILSGNSKRVIATVRGNVKKNDSVLIGDMVEVSNVYDKYMIEKVMPRKNQLIRPRVSNIDNLVIVVSLKDPKPDYILLDKQIILCYQKKITPIICLNKFDLVEGKNEDVEYIEKVYKNLGIEVIITSAKENVGIDILKEKLKGKISAFSGNSGVGKSSIVSLYTSGEIKTNEIAKKTKRGRHTTKKASLFEIKHGTYILDTPGFSSYELYDIEPKKLKEYYKEFNEFRCEYDDCNHINEAENVCNIKRQVSFGKIDKRRYEGYVFLYNKLKEIDDRKYR